MLCARVEEELLRGIRVKYGERCVCVCVWWGERLVLLCVYARRKESENVTFKHF